MKKYKGEECGCEACIAERTVDNVFDWRNPLVPKKKELKEVKVLQILCQKCDKIGRITISDNMEMDSEFFEFAKIKLSEWQKYHCKS